MINADFHTGNRQALRKKVQTELIILAGHDEVHRRADAAFAFVQESSFYYLTGIKEAAWRLVMIGGRELLVSPNRSDAQALFDGSLSKDDAVKISGIDEIISQQEWKVLLDALKAEHEVVATIGEDPHKKYYSFSLNPGPEKNLRVLKRAFSTLDDIRPILSRLRSIKQPVEIEAMQQAIDITIKGFSTVRSQISALKSEAQAAAHLTFDFLSHGAEGHAYDPIVAGGLNACTLHYGSNSAALTQGELLLIDAGAQYGEYAADITRTYIVGDAADRQRDVHSAVAKAHLSIIKLIKPGVLLKDYSEQSDDIMKSALKELGLYKKPSDFRKYFPHAISHGLGIDVHESLGGYEAFMPGMVLTVEPGIYIPEEKIGIRIEDDILVTEGGNRNLSAALPISL